MEPSNHMVFAKPQRFNIKYSRGPFPCPILLKSGSSLCLMMYLHEHLTCINSHVNEVYINFGSDLVSF